MNNYENKISARELTDEELLEIERDLEEAQRLERIKERWRDIDKYHEKKKSDKNEEDVPKEDVDDYIKKFSE